MNPHKLNAQGTTGRSSEAHKRTRHSSRSCAGTRDQADTLAGPLAPARERLAPAPVPVPVLVHLDPMGTTGTQREARTHTCRSPRIHEGTTRMAESWAEIEVQATAGSEQEQVPQQVPEQAPEQAPGQAPVVPEQAPEQVPAMLEQAPGLEQALAVPAQAPEVPEQAPVVPEQVPEVPAVPAVREQVLAVPEALEQAPSVPAAPARL